MVLLYGMNFQAKYVLSVKNSSFESSISFLLQIISSDVLYIIW